MTGQKDGREDSQKSQNGKIAWGFCFRRQYQGAGKASLCNPQSSTLHPQAPDPRLVSRVFRGY